MTTARPLAVALSAALLVLAACGPKDAPEATPPAESGSAPAETAPADLAPAADALPEVVYYKISDG